LKHFFQAIAFPPYGITLSSDPAAPLYLCTRQYENATNTSIGPNHQRLKHSMPPFIPQMLATNGPSLDWNRKYLQPSKSRLSEGLLESPFVISEARTKLPERRTLVYEPYRRNIVLGAGLPSKRTLSPRYGPPQTRAILKKRAESRPTGRRLALTRKHRTDALVDLFDGMVWDDMLRRGVWKSAEPVLNVLTTSWS